MSGHTRFETELSGTESSSHTSTFKIVNTVSETEFNDLMKTTVTCKNSLLFPWKLWFITRSICPKVKQPGIFWAPLPHPSKFPSRWLPEGYVRTKCLLRTNKRNPSYWT